MGRPMLPVTKKSISVTLMPDQRAFLEKLGNGNASEGIRILVEKELERLKKAQQDIKDAGLE